MRSLLLLLLLSACDNGPFPEPVQTSSLVQRQPEPADCRATCVASREQLIRDFGFTQAQVDCDAPEFVGARDCASCRELLRVKFGLELTNCR